ncbi:hypothetical protein COT68_03065 [bacterium (Candidatus Torokbacteria) CG09_land_8_20_14_0_10_42_11]|nr:MAG: hypothetical protein COT68_03065 [bacterium (Candidatus Torokbacteria) CG09_land_8_20_14_0_10_42_11]
MMHNLDKKLFDAIRSINWIYGTKRELYFINAIATKSYCYGSKRLGVKPQVFSLFSGKGAVWTIWRPKKYFYAVLRSLVAQLKTEPDRARKNMQALKDLNKLADKISVVNVAKLKTKKEQSKFLNKLEDLVGEYWLFYINNNFLAYSIERFGVKTKFLKRILALRDIPNYLKLESVFKKFVVCIGLNTKEAKFYTFQDVKDFLLKNKRPKTAERKGSVLLFSERAKVFIITKGVKNIEKFLENQNKVVLTSNNEIKGVSAFRGIVRGKVAVAEMPNDYKKIKKGEILVTAMTRPDITSYLKNVKAIITDEGGILCHAAIISREMKKPCIIGTKIATKVLKDGDLIEVDANKGIIKIIKKAKTS